MEKSDCEVQATEGGGQVRVRNRIKTKVQLSNLMIGDLP